MLRRELLKSLAAFPFAGLAMPALARATPKKWETPTFRISQFKGCKYPLELNVARITKDVLSPGWPCRVMVSTYPMHLGEDTGALMPIHRIELSSGLDWSIAGDVDDNLIGAPNAFGSFSFAFHWPSYCRHYLRELPETSADEVVKRVRRDNGKVEYDPAFTAATWQTLGTLCKMRPMGVSIQFCDFNAVVGPANNYQSPFTTLYCDHYGFAPAGVEVHLIPDENDKCTRQAAMYRTLHRERRDWARYLVEA